jgi:L-proline amide hydrolase
MISTATGVPFEGVMERQGLRTWYRVVASSHGEGGHGESAGLPVVVCHGGPGLTHDYLLQVAALSGYGRACVFYDQFGNGRSGHRRSAPAEFWTVDLFVQELQSLIEYLGLSDGYHLLGHSWGGMLALELAASRPKGLRSIVAADAFASSACHAAQVARLVDQLPTETRSAIERHEAAGTTASAEYQEAVRVFYRKHVCRTTPIPDEVRSTLAALGDDPTVYQTMAGSSEFRLTGTLREWDIIDRLHLIRVPVLVVSGRHDEVAPGAVEQLWRGLASARWVIFEESSHMPHIEEHSRFIATVAEFLRQNDGFV